ncbi:hypothetical protein KI387_015329, partial [Taxus chinensis]
IVTGACVVFIVAILAVVFYRRKRLQMEIRTIMAKERAEILAVNNGGKPAKLFTIKEIHKAKNTFAGDQLLGVGGFGEVYKGILKDGTNVAVKTAKVGNIKGTERVLKEAIPCATARIGYLSKKSFSSLVISDTTWASLELGSDTDYYTPNKICE